KDNQDGIRMLLAQLVNLCSGMPIARSDAAHVLPRQAVEAVNFCSRRTGPQQQLAKRRPVISPISLKAYAAAEFVCIDFAALPFVDDPLIASDDRLNTNDHFPSSSDKSFDHRCGVQLRSRERVIIA